MSSRQQAAVARSLAKGRQLLNARDDRLPHQIAASSPLRETLDTDLGSGLRLAITCANSCVSTPPSSMYSARLWAVTSKPAITCPNSCVSIAPLGVCSASLSQPFGSWSCEPGCPLPSDWSPTANTWFRSSNSMVTALSSKRELLRKTSNRQPTFHLGTMLSASKQRCRRLHEKLELSSHHAWCISHCLPG